MRQGPLGAQQEKTLIKVHKAFLQPLEETWGRGACSLNLAGGPPQPSSGSGINSLCRLGGALPSAGPRPQESLGPNNTHKSEGRLQAVAMQGEEAS